MVAATLLHCAMLFITQKALRSTSQDLYLVHAILIATLVLHAQKIMLLVLEAFIEHPVVCITGILGELGQRLS